jgi:hypothetical protein
MDGPTRAHRSTPDGADQAGASGRHRPDDRFWPYVDLPQEPTAEELAALDPDIREVLCGPEPRPFSITVVFPRLDDADYERAVAIARRATEYGEIGSGDAVRHRARFRPGDVGTLRDLWQIVGDFDETEVLVDDRPVPYARELWLPLVWLLIP